MRTLKVHVQDSVTRDRVERICERLAGSPARSTRVWEITHPNLTQAQGYAIKDLLNEGRRITDINYEAVEMQVTRNREQCQRAQNTINRVKTRHGW